MYNGKEICQGCKRPGTEVPRMNKNSLCEDCKKELRKAKAINFEIDTKYIRIYQHRYAYSSLEFNDNTLNKFVIDILKILDNPNAKVINTIDEFKPEPGDNKILATIPEKLFKPLKEFFLKINNFIKETSEEREALPKMARDAIQSEKDKIYNDGIERGRNLLLQLNNHEITPEQFSGKYHYSG